MPTLESLLSIASLYITIISCMMTSIQYRKRSYCPKYQFLYRMLKRIIVFMRRDDNFCQVFWSFLKYGVFKQCSVLLVISTKTTLELNCKIEFVSWCLLFTRFSILRLLVILKTFMRALLRCFEIGHEHTLGKCKEVLQFFIEHFCTLKHNMGLEWCRPLALQYSVDPLFCRIVETPCSDFKQNSVDPLL